MASIAGSQGVMLRLSSRPRDFSCDDSRWGACVAGRYLTQCVPSPSTFPHPRRPNAFPSTSVPVPSRYVGGRRSETALAGMFGLGAPEIAVCLVVAAVVLGPDKLAGEAQRRRLGRGRRA